MTHHAHYQRLPSRFLGRPVHLWTYGFAGTPILVFPSAAGMAHEWQSSSAVSMFGPLIDAGKVRLFCPESNVSEAWTGAGSASWRLDRHRAYERFIAEELRAFIDGQVGRRTRILATGCSFGSFYAANLALKHPDWVARAVCLSGRYRTEAFLDGFYDDRVYFADPLHYVPNLEGDALQRARRTHLTLVVGQGDFEGRCVEETRDLATVLLRKKIPCTPDFWGHDVSHHWDWWKRQLWFHIGRHLGGPTVGSP